MYVFPWKVTFTIRAKTMLQEMWVAGLDWDDPLPGKLINRTRQ